MNTDRTFCPQCGHKFEQGESNLDYDTGATVYTCPDCDWEGTGAIDDAKIESDLFDEFEEADIERDVTDEDVSAVMDEIEFYGESYSDAINKVMNNI